MCLSSVIYRRKKKTFCSMSVSAQTIHNQARPLLCPQLSSAPDSTISTVCQSLRSYCWHQPYCLLLILTDLVSLFHTEMCSQMFHYQTPLLLVCIILPIITWNHRAKKRTMLAACLCIFKKTKGSSIFGWQVYIVQKLDKKCGTWAKMFNYEFTAGEELPAPF